uniref:Uncharacterized protein n=1 Tax=Populus alba TaxID=43335 RepID=A0A4U5Q812_POPAL|nr:hypothetical protein D5086_0000139430 [Populus alba]
MKSRLDEKTNPLSEKYFISQKLKELAHGSGTGEPARASQISPETEQKKLLWEEAEKRTKLKRKENLRMRVWKGPMHCWLKGRFSVTCQHWQTEKHSYTKILALRTLLFVNHSKGTFMAVLVEDCLCARLELTFSNAYAFAGAAPCFFEVDDVDFLKPASLNPLPSIIAVWNRF